VIGILSSCGLSIGGGIESGAGCPADGGVDTEGKGGTESKPQGLSVGPRRVDLKKKNKIILKLTNEKIFKKHMN